MVQDYGQIGNSLRQRDIQYIANKDEYGVWRILDTWHSEMASMTLVDELEIPDDSEAVLVIKEGQFLALMKEVEQKNYMPTSAPKDTLFDIANEEINYDRDNKELSLVTEERNKLLADQKEKQASSEKHELAMRKLDLLETMSNKGNLELDIAELLNSVG